MKRTLSTFYSMQLVKLKLLYHYYSIYNSDKFMCIQYIKNEIHVQVMLVLLYDGDKVSLDNSSDGKSTPNNCVPLDDGLPVDDGGNGLHIDVW